MIKALVFDLGGVLVELAPVQTVFSHSAHEDEAEFWRCWLHSDTVRRFETGQSSLFDFISDIKAELKLELSYEELVQRHRSFVQGVYPGVFKLLERLRSRYTLVSLSNNNPVHWPIMMSDYGFEPYFDYHFPSHITGFIKPDGDAFENVISQLELAPEQIIFLDDNIINVDAARQAGMQAFEVKGFAAAQALLKERLQFIA